MNDKCGMTDEVVAELGYGRGPSDRVGIRGHVIAELFGPDGKLKMRQETHNLVTDIGDVYAAERFGIAATSAPTFYMKTGTDATAVAKNGDGSYISTGTYNAHSVAGMEVGYPQISVGGTAAFRSAWPDDADHVYTVRRVCLTSDSTNAGEAEETSLVLAVALFDDDIVKTAADTLTVTWNITFTGS